MTKQRRRKKRVRDRKAMYGESYTIALRKITAEQLRVRHDTASSSPMSGPRNGLRPSE